MADEYPSAVVIKLRCRGCKAEKRYQRKDEEKGHKNERT
jgi:hypothetical protein